MPKRHLIISGTGRAGTTFLTQLLTELGLDTGFSNSTSRVFASCNAGMELEIRRPDAPYIVKSPAMSEHIEGLLDAGEIMVDCAIIPIRDLFASAESRRFVSRKSKKKGARGGLWLTKNPRQQEAVLARQLHALVHALAKHDVPMIWLHFPRLVQDPDYLYDKLKAILPGKNLEAFARAFKAVSRPELVHDFKPKAAAKRNCWQMLKGWFQK